MPVVASEGRMKLLYLAAIAGLCLSGCGWRGGRWRGVARAERRFAADAVFVEFQLEQDDGFQALCDIRPGMSCSEVGRRPRWAAGWARAGG